MNSHKDTSRPDSPDNALGAVQQDRPGQKTNAAPLREQMDHRAKNDLVKSADSDFPEPGLNPEYSMQKEDSENAKDNAERAEINKNVEGTLNDVDPGARQKENQNDKKDDSLAA